MQFWQTLEVSQEAEYQSLNSEQNSKTFDFWKNAENVSQDKKNWVLEYRILSTFVSFVLRVGVITP